MKRVTGQAEGCPHGPALSCREGEVRVHRRTRREPQPAPWTGRRASLDKAEAVSVRVPRQTHVSPVASRVYVPRRGSARMNHTLLLTLIPGVGKMVSGRARGTSPTLHTEAVLISGFLCCDPPASDEPHRPAGRDVFHWGAGGISGGSPSGSPPQ